MNGSLSGSNWVVLRQVLSTTLLVWLAFAAVSKAHEVVPAIADMSDKNGVVTIDVKLNVEGFIAGIDLSSVEDTNLAVDAKTYDEMRALQGPELEQRFKLFWPQMADKISIRTGDRSLSPELVYVQVPETGNMEFVRTTEIRFQVVLPPGAEVIEIGWAREFGALVLRQIGVDKPYEAYLDGGTLSEPIPLAGGGELGVWKTLSRYILVGFDHIIPKGLDHILFVLGLYLLSPQIRPLLWQVSAFTFAHTFTLAAGALGYVSIPSYIVEPIIAASIVYVAVENIFANGLNPWRPAIVFGFGLLHGLGFASVLGEFGLPPGGFIAALIGFNVGVELGQLAVIAFAFLVCGYWFRNKVWYRRALAVPSSALIALIGGYWFVERVFLVD
jgi:hydrogenase/urease accessory protein HupE